MIGCVCVCAGAYAGCFLVAWKPPQPERRVWSIVLYVHTMHSIAVIDRGSAASSGGP